MPLRILLAASETPDQQAARRERTGQASHETYADTLRRLAPGCALDHADALDGDAWTTDRLRGFDGVVFPGSPIQMYEDTPDTRAAAAFMARVFAAGVPSFGSCAGLQIAAVAAGGTVGPREGPMEAGVVRGVVRADAGRGHALLEGRPDTWDAPAMHATIVTAMPEGGTVLARAGGTPVEAAEIRQGGGTFWGVQYHPEIALGEIALTLRAQADGLVEEGLARDGDDVDRYADKLRDLDRDPSRRDLAWQTGLGAEVTDPDRRTTEIQNALTWFAGR